MGLSSNYAEEYDGESTVMLILYKCGYDLIVINMLRRNDDERFYELCGVLGSSLARTSCGKY